MNCRIWRSARCKDDQKIRGRASMTNKKAAAAPSTIPLPATPSSLSGLRRHKTPGSKSQYTPSIRDFLSPSLRSPVSSSVAVEGGKRARRNLEDESTSGGSCSKKPRILFAGASSLLPKPSSPVKCTFSPTSYRSPSKQTCFQRSPAKRMAMPISLQISPVKSPVLASPLRGVLARLPLSTISPTANLPNLVRDGVQSPQPKLKPVKRENWLTQILSMYLSMINDFLT